MHDLIKLYRIYNPSGQEFKMTQHVQEKLDQLGIKDYQVDPNGQIYRFNEGVPLVSAHLDSVSKSRPKGIHLDYEKGIIRGTNNIGADDKNGIWIVLRLLELRPDLSFIFSVEEEVGGKVNELPLDQLKVPYALIFDRKGASDIIGVKNDYCCEDLENEIYRLGTDYGFKPCLGVLSDCDVLYQYVPCVNLSCGYHLAHTEKEYTVISELDNSFRFGLHLIDNIPLDIEYEIAEVTYPGYSSYFADWLCVCGQVNDVDEWKCTDCDTSFWEGMALEFTDDDEDLDWCPRCGELHSDPEYCTWCEFDTFKHFNVG